MTVAVMMVDVVALMMRLRVTLMMMVITMTTKLLFHKQTKLIIPFICLLLIVISALYWLVKAKTTFEN